MWAPKCSFEADKAMKRLEFDWNIEPVMLCQSWYG